MRWQEKQNKIEAAVYDVVDELSNELNISISTYPEVWWLGKKVKFADLCLPNYLKAEFKIRRKQGVSYYIIDQQIVVIADSATNHSILEEASHAFHLISSGVSYNNKDVYNSECLACLIEMFGFLGARLAGSQLENPYEKFPDLVYLSKKSQAMIKYQLVKIFGADFNFDNFFVHQQGYGLADRIYFEYLGGEVSIDRLRQLFLSNFSAPDSAVRTFIRLKNEFWPKEIL